MNGGLVLLWQLRACRALFSGVRKSLSRLISFIACLRARLGRHALRRARLAHLAPPREHPCLRLCLRTRVPARPPASAAAS